MKFLKHTYLFILFFLLLNIPVFASTQSSNISILTIVYIQRSCNYISNYSYNNINYICSIGNSPTILNNSDSFLNLYPLIADGYSHNTFFYSNKNDVNMVLINY